MPSTVALVGEFERARRHASRSGLLESTGQPQYHLRTMMTCPDCQTNLDEVPVESPCPNCGSHRRDATVSPETVAAVAHVIGGHQGPAGEPGKSRIVFTGQEVSLVVTPGIETFLARSNASPAVWDRTRRRAEELAIGSTVRTIVFHDPGEGGTVLCEARDGSGSILDAKPGRDAADALLNVAEALLPPPAEDDKG